MDKTHFVNKKWARCQRFGAASIICLSLACLVLPAAAQTIEPIYSFSFTNVNGPANPYAPLTLGPDGSFYGTTGNGGSNGWGTVFRITTNGTLTTLASFAYNNGYSPEAALALGPDGNFYSTAVAGGSNNQGTVFRVATNGALTTLAAFNNTNGAFSDAGLTLGPDGNFYGTAAIGGSNGDGTVFQITTDGTLAPLASFAGGTNASQPNAGLALGSDGIFYGTTFYGGSNNAGTVFRITANGTLTTLASFGNTNGAAPHAELTLGLDGNFYGTTEFTAYIGGGSGTVFRITTNGSLTTLHSFSSTLFNAIGVRTNADGANPWAALTLGPDGNFYGTSGGGGSAGGGTVFRITTNGTLTVLASFDASTGTNPTAGLTLGPDGNFYGTISRGGSGGAGTVYRLNLSPSIFTQPMSEGVPIGGTANFSVGAWGSPPLAYQWYFNTNTPLSGATNANLSFGPVLTNQAGQYQVIVTNPYGSATSDLASLTVLLQPNCYGISNSGSGTVTLSLASTPNSTNRLWATTNLSLPLSQWHPISTNTADPTGLFQFIDTNTGDSPAKFYILSSP